MTPVRRNIGYLIIFFSTLFPVIVWVNIMPLNIRFINLYTSLTSIGQIAALAGMVLFCWSLLLSARLKIFEDFFKGMNGVYIAHHTIGGLAFIFLIIHPLFLAGSYLTISVKEAALFLLPHEDWTVNLGIASLLCLMALLILTYYVDLPYQVWRLTHKFLGFVFFLGGLHAFFIPGVISTDSTIRVYILGFSVIAFIFYSFKTILGRFLVFRYRYCVDKIVSLKDEMVEVKMHPIGEPMSYKAGQFIFISFWGKGISSEDHPFSLCSSPSSRELSIIVKSLGDYSATLSTIPEGTLAKIEGPFGRFTFEDFKEENQIWIAGGVGITPFLSMARTFYDLDYKVDLYYCVRSEDEAVYLDELNSLSQKYTNFKIIPYFTKEKGRLTADIIEQISGDLKGKEFLFCGPPPMMISLKRQLRAKGVKTAFMHSEEFEML